MTGCEILTLINKHQTNVIIVDSGTMLKYTSDYFKRVISPYNDLIQTAEYFRERKPYIQDINRIIVFAESTNEIRFTPVQFNTPVSKREAAKQKAAKFYDGLFYKHKRK